MGTTTGLGSLPAVKTSKPSVIMSRRAPPWPQRKGDLYLFRLLPTIAPSTAAETAQDMIWQNNRIFESEQVFDAFQMISPDI